MLDGAEWEPTMAEYHRRRDQAVMSGYKGTIAYTQAQDPSPEALSWLQAVAANAGLVRTLGHAFPMAVQTPGIFPPVMLPVIERSAERFAAAAQPDARRVA
jgi:hypothetical protein